MVEVMAVTLYDNLRTTTDTRILFKKDNKVYRGALFMELDKKHEEIRETLDTVVVEASGEELEALKAIKAYFDLCKKYKIKTYKSTLKTMLLWSYSQGFSPMNFSLCDRKELARCAMIIDHNEQR